MEAVIHPGTQRDNAGYVSVATNIPHGCKGPSCPAFALCQGRCATRPARKAAHILEGGLPQTYQP